MCKTLELQVRKSVAYCKLFWWELERQELSVHSGALAHVVSEGSEELGWGHSCGILTRDLVVFCLCPETLREAKLKDNNEPVCW